MEAENRLTQWVKEKIEKEYREDKEKLQNLNLGSWLVRLI